MFFSLSKDLMQEYVFPSLKTSVTLLSQKESQCDTEKRERENIPFFSFLFRVCEFESVSQLMFYSKNTILTNKDLCIGHQTPKLSEIIRDGSMAFVSPFDCRFIRGPGLKWQPCIKKLPPLRRTIRLR